MYARDALYGSVAAAAAYLRDCLALRGPQIPERKQDFQWRWRARTRAATSTQNLACGRGLGSPNLGAQRCPIVRSSLLPQTSILWGVGGLARVLAPVAEDVGIDPTNNFILPVKPI